MPHLQKRVYPGMADQSFDSTQMSSQDKINLSEPRYPGQQYQNMYPETSTTPNQSSIDQRSMSQLQGSNIQRQDSKIESDQMPRPLKLLNAYNYRAGIPERFPTKSQDLPPQAGVPFIQIDEGQVGPKFMRCTVLQAPIEQAFQQQSSIPFGFVVQPLAEMTQNEYNNEISDVPLVDHGEDGPFRCHRCKAYVSSYMLFQNGGTQAQCNLCLYVNDVPVNYQSQLNEFGQRRDKQQRPELQFGAYEFKAPSSYLTRKLQMPTFVFVIDVSQFSLPLGLFQQVVQSIKASLDYIQNPENTTVCFFTYDVNVHFYNLPLDPNGEPTILWVGEVSDPFIPFPKEKLLLKLVEDRERIDIFLDKLLNMHQMDNKKYQPPFLCTGAALSAAKELLHEEGGRILLFTSNIASCGLGQLTYRDDPKLYNSDKEKALLSPVNDIYVKMAEGCVKDRICIDIFMCTNNAKSVDITTIAPAAALTGGDIYYYNPFDVMKHGEKLHYEIFRVLSRASGSEIALKARTSTGFTVTEYFGGFGVKESVDFELSSIDSDKFIGFSIRNDEKLKEDSLCYVQFAMMYTTNFGERRIRVFNMCLQVAKTLNGYYKAADCEVLSQFMIKKELCRLMARGAKTTRENITNNLVNLLYVYRQKCAAQTSPSQLILPDNLKLLPLNTLAALKNPALRMFPSCKLDEKIYWMYKLLKMPISHIPYFFYPRIYKVTDVGQEGSTLGTYAEGSQSMLKPYCCPASLEKLGSKDAYIIDNGEWIWLYIGNQVDDAFITNTFAQIEGYEASQTLWNFIEQIRYEKCGGAYAPLRLIYAGDTVNEREMIEQCLVEDSVDINKEFPYTDFLCMLHKLIRNKTQ